MIEQLKQYSLIPVVKIENADNVNFLCEALLKGGLNCIEITFRTKYAEKALKTVKKNFPSMLVGAGTVITEKQINIAEDCGVDFLVSPGLNPNQIKKAKEKNILMIPGTITPSEVETALSMNLKLLKFFPAVASGGIEMLKAFNAVYPALFMPTGGINLNNINSFLSLPNVTSCGGSWITPSSLIDNGEWDKITQLVKEALEVINIGEKI